MYRHLCLKLYYSTLLKLHYPFSKKIYRIEIYIFYDVTHRIVGKVWEVEQPIKRCDADT